MKKSKLNKLILLFLLIIITISTNSTDLIYANYKNENIKITAHRGSSTFYPDNTFVSMNEAVLERADYIEIDVRVTKDGKIVVFHDKNLKRVCNLNMKIEDMTLKEIKNIDNGSYKNQLFKGEKIPTLEEVFERYKDKIKFNLHLKVSDKNDILIKEVDKIIDKYHMNSNVIITCSNREIIEKYKKENPKSKTGLIMGKNINKIENCSCDLFSLKYDLVSKEVVDKIHKNNKEVHVWTVNDADKISRLIDLGVDNIITNNVPLTKGVLRYKEYKQ